MTAQGTASSSSDCADFLEIYSRCGQRLVALETGKIRAEFFANEPESSSKPSIAFDEPGLPEHVREDLMKQKEIEDNLLPDEIDG